MFENFVSLGSNCEVAASLNKYGLRSMAGPFDWCVSSFEGVIASLENDFADFMNYENLIVVKENGGGDIFEDVKYKIRFTHDRVTLPENDYLKMREKYQKRTECLVKMIQKPTCFVRRVAGRSELKFIAEQEKRICSIVQKYNKKNDIIFVVPKCVYEQEPIEVGLKIFLVDITEPLGIFGRKEIRKGFDTNEELIKFCIDNYNQDKRKDNLIFNLQSELELADKENISETVSAKMLENYKNRILERNEKITQLNSRLARWERVINTDYSSIEYSGKIAIYGCGAIGRTLYNYMKNDFDIIEFIDKRPRQEKYDGVPVSSIEHSISDMETLIIVVPSYDYEKIVLELAERFTFRPNTIKIEEFLVKGKVLDPYF